MSLHISLVFIAAMLYFTGGPHAFQEFMMVFSDIPVAVFFIAIGGAFLLQVAFCLLVFGKAARRHLLKVQTEQAKAGA